MNEYDISVEKDDVQEVYSVKIASDLLEINIRIPECDIDKLKKVRSANWENGTLKIGSSAGSPVFWSSDEQGMIDLLIGMDDEMWDIGIRLPENILLKLLDILPVD